MNLGILKFNSDYAETRKAYETAQQLRQQALQYYPTSGKLVPGHAKLLRDIAKGEYNLGDLSLGENDDESNQEAAVHFEKAAQLLDQLLADEPRDLENQHLLGICYRILGDLSADNKKIDEARKWYKQSGDRLRHLTEANPDVVDYRLAFAGLLMNNGLLESQNAALDAAKTAFEGASNILAPLVQQSPGDSRLRYDLGMALSALGEQQIKTGEMDAGISNLKLAHEHFLQLKDEMPEGDVQDRILPKLKSIEDLLNSAAVSSHGT